ncbi:FtsX-like permease family protein [Streptomyces mirabilis]|uniref:ABC transporter permease n=1 Tax=Streptomyces mirabilis TaxID=68239 RepID=UPI00332AA38E
MRADLRWIRADLRSHRLHSLLVVLAVAGTAAALLLASSLLTAATDVWQHQFSAGHLPHVRVDLAPPAAARSDDDPARTALARQPGVSSVTPEQRTAEAQIVGQGAPGHIAVGTGSDRDGRVPLTLRADTPGVPHPSLDAGRWLTSGTLGQLVLERSAAQASWARPGDLLTLQNADGHLFQLQVIGVADSVEQIPYNQAGYGLGWVTQSTLDQLDPDRTTQGRTIGLYLDDPGTAGNAARRAVAVVGSERVLRLTTWQDARSAWEEDNRLTGLLLGLSGLAALIAAALAVTGAAAGRIRASTGGIALLKTIGFTRARVVRLFALQHLVLAGTGIVLGALGAALTAQLNPVWQVGLGRDGGLLPGGAAALGGTTAAALTVISLAAALPAHRASLVPPVLTTDAGKPRTTRAPRPSRLGLLRHLPTAVVLGLRGTWRDRGANAITVLRLAAPVMACTLALCTWSTLDVLAGTSAGGVTPAALTVHPAFVETGRDDARLRTQLASDASVAAVYPSTDMTALAAGRSATLTLRAVGTAVRPYPLRVVQGRAARSVDEAVAGQGALDVLGATVGDWVRITTGSTVRKLHIVGRDLEPDNAGRVLSTSMDTLDQPGDPVVPAYYMVVLRHGADRTATRRELSRRTGPGTGLTVEPPPDHLRKLSMLRGAVIALTSLLGLIALAELLTTTASGLRAHRHELVVLRTIGLTPRQAQVIMATRSGTLAVVGSGLGITLGVPLALRLIDLQGRADGVGAGIAEAPSAQALLLLATVLAAAAALLAGVPAGRTARGDGIASLR